MHEREPGSGVGIHPDRGRPFWLLNLQRPQQREGPFVRRPSRRHPGRRRVPGQQATGFLDQRPAQERRALDDVSFEGPQLGLGQAGRGRMAERQQQREVGERRARLGFDALGALRECEEAGGGVHGRAPLDVRAESGSTPR